MITHITGINWWNSICYTAICLMDTIKNHDSLEELLSLSEEQL